jgi:hypothetical protein
MAAGVGVSAAANLCRWGVYGLALVVGLEGFGPVEFGVLVELTLVVRRVVGGPAWGVMGFGAVRQVGGCLRRDEVRLGASLEIEIEVG